MDISNIYEALIYGIAFGLLHFSLVWFFINSLDDKRLLVFAATASVVSAVAGVAAWLMRPLAFSDSLLDTHIVTWFVVLGICVLTATISRYRQLSMR